MNGGEAALGMMEADDGGEATLGVMEAPGYRRKGPHNVVGPLRPGSGHYVPGMYLAIMGPRLRTLINKF